MSNAENLKAITRHLVSRVGGSKCAAHICGVSETEIGYWKNDQHDRFIPIDHLVDLDKAASDLFLKEWARTRGFELVALDVQQNNAPSILNVIGRFSKNAGELDCVALEAASDGKISATERRRIRDQIAPVKDSLAQLENAIS